MAKQQAAFQALVELAHRSRRAAKGLPAQVDITPHWSGVGFSLLGMHFVSPMGVVSEMLEVPPYTRLPGVQPWVRGVANVRGRLLPLFDLAAFFGGRLQTHRKLRRVLILEAGGLYSGLIVDRVFGMQHFPVDTYTTDLSGINAELRSLVSGSYELDEQRWWVLNPATLAENARFVNAAKL
ncbi:chemotaxis protein CheW [Exilibacterium tricleocarpae]|uniref:Chemotaxis protein CheW n=1 Tax=Exilibacterium tricleocarpae TaxID=2591008 RepID=A0A545SXF0_9GAMM|nr:chemotaxis protein CheW [Exilibacterium tricleocarpae]TQV69634.1 chemotaxis protein CheW [Exilibacterium tricleocarpae]